MIMATVEKKMKKSQNLNFFLRILSEFWGKKSGLPFFPTVALILFPNYTYGAR